MEKGTRPHFVAISLGSNLGDRRAHLDHAIRELSHHLDNFLVSSIVATDPVEVHEVQPQYLNAAIVGLTQLPPRQLLDRLLAIEQERGRARPHPMAPRTLDLDLILYGNETIEEEGLRVPHPRFRERDFVLAPLAEIAPDLIDPVTGRSIAELRRQLLET